MALAGYKLRINGTTIIDVGLVYSYVITGLTEGVPIDVEIAAYDEFDAMSDWSAVVTNFPVCAELLLDDDDEQITDDDDEDIVAFDV